MQSIFNHIKIEDAVVFRAKQLVVAADGDIHSMATARAEVLKLLCYMPNEILRSQYIYNLCKMFRWKLTDTKKQFTTLLAQSIPDKKSSVYTNEDELTDDDILELEDPEKFPAWAKEHFKQWKDDGFISCNKVVNGKTRCGFFSIVAKQRDDGKAVYSTTELSNFMAQPIMHVYNGPESLFIFRITNHKVSAIIEVPAASIPTPETFQKYCIGEGNFMIYCSTLQWKRIASSLLEKFTKCISIPFLGWQKDGFFAFVNGAYVPGIGWQPTDENGLISHNKEQFLIPASSQVYLKAVGRNTDAYESDRPLVYQQGQTAFSEWASMMYKVYGDKGILAIAAIPMALFRDIVFSVDNNCPLLYAFGEPSSGKSKYAESINAVFFKKRMAFNVNSGTDHAFFSYMQRFINTVAWLNEVDEATLKPEWFQALKGAYDGESRERGRIVSGKLKTEIQKIESIILLTGQKLITADDNSLVTRCLIEGFSKEDNRTEDQVNNYNKLKELEETGLTWLITEVLQHRSYYKEHYKNTINELLGIWRKHKKEARQCNQRILQNWAHALANYMILSEKFSLPVGVEIFNDYCFKKAVYWSKFISTSDVLSEFWATVQNLYNTKQLIEGWDYVIKNQKEITIDSGKVDLQDVVPVLYLRLGNVIPLYEKDSRSRGKQYMSKDNVLHYFSSRKYFIGAVRSNRFYKFETVASSSSNGGATQQFSKIETNASCHAFRYEDLNIEITINDGAKEMPF